MNWDRMEGCWKQFKGRAQVGWAQITADAEQDAAGRRAMLAGKLQEAYGIGRDEAHLQVSDWQKSIQEIADDHAATHRVRR